MLFPSPQVRYHKISFETSAKYSEIHPSFHCEHYNDVIMTTMASQITSLMSCLPNRLFRRRSKKTSKLRVTGLCAGNSPGPVNSPHKGPVTRKLVPFDDAIMKGFIDGRARVDVVEVTGARIHLVFRMISEGIVHKFSREYMRIFN